MKQPLANLLKHLFGSPEGALNENSKLVLLVGFIFVIIVIAVLVVL